MLLWRDLSLRRRDGNFEKAREMVFSEREVWAEDLLLAGFEGLEVFVEDLEESEDDWLEESFEEVFGAGSLAKSMVPEAVWFRRMNSTSTS